MPFQLVRLALPNQLQVLEVIVVETATGLSGAFDAVLREVRHSGVVGPVARHHHMRVARTLIKNVLDVFADDARVLRSADLWGHFE
jgi:hypothetical protein